MLDRELGIVFDQSCKLFYSCKVMDGLMSTTTDVYSLDSMKVYGLANGLIPKAQRESRYIGREKKNMHCQGIACTRSFGKGLTSAEGQKLKCFK